MPPEYDDAALDKGHAVCEDASTTVIHGAWNANRISEEEWIMQFYKAVFSSSVHDGICMTVNKSLGFQFSMFRRSVDEAMPSPGHRDMDGASAATVGNTARFIHRNGGFSFDTERCQLHETTNFCDIAPNGSMGFQFAPRSSPGGHVRVANTGSAGVRVAPGFLKITRNATGSSQGQRQGVDAVCDDVGLVEEASRERPHKCEYCVKSFKRAYHLKRHCKSHTGDKPHRCTVCGASFTRKDSLTKHRRSHTGGKSHPCDRCGK